MEQYEDFSFTVDENINKHKPNVTGGKEYTVINSPLYTAHNDKILYASDINWGDIGIMSGTGTAITDHFSSTTDVLNFIASQFNLMNEEIAALDSRIKELENNKQATVVSAEIIKQDNIYDGIILYIGESIKFPKPTVKLTFSDDSIEYVTANDNNLTWEITHLSLQGATFKEGSESDDGQSGEQTGDQAPTDETTTSVKISSINYHNYIKHNHTGVNVFFGGVNGADIFNDYSSKTSRHPLSYLYSAYITDPDANGTYPYRILDKYYHGVGQSGLSGQEFIYAYEPVYSYSYSNSRNALIDINTNIDNDYNEFEINVNAGMSYSYLASFDMNAKYHDANTNSYITTNELHYNNILFAPKKNITINILGSRYNLPVKAACHADGNGNKKTLSGQYDITKLTDNNEYLSTIADYSYFDIEDRNHNKHIIYGFTTTSQEGDPQTLSYIFTHQELPIDYIKLPDDMWYKKSYIGDNTNWQNRSNSYYAYFDANEYNSNPRNIYAYIGNRLTFVGPNSDIIFSYIDVKSGDRQRLPALISSYMGKRPIGWGEYDGYSYNANYTNYEMNSYITPERNMTLYAKYGDQQTPEPTEYYWYAGQDQPGNSSENPLVDDSSFTNNKWHTLNESQIEKTITGGTAGTTWKIAVPTIKDFKPYASDMATPETTWTKTDIITVNSVSYDIWITSSTGAKVNIYMK